MSKVIGLSVRTARSWSADIDAALSERASWALAIAAAVDAGGPVPSEFLVNYRAARSELESLYAEEADYRAEAMAAALVRAKRLAAGGIA
jgi:hypothetical protein